MTDGVVGTLTPSFTWDAMSGATSYEIEYGTSFSGTPTATGIATTGYTAVGSLTDFEGGYGVKVRARNVGGVSEWSSAVLFGVSTLAGRLRTSGERWTMDESSAGSAAVTRVAQFNSAHNLTDAASAASITGKFSNAVDLDGTTDNLWTASDTLLRTGDVDWTLTAWVYPYSATPNLAYIGKHNGNFFNGTTTEYALISGTPSGVMNLYLIGKQGSTGYTTAGVAAAANAWHFVAFGYDSTADQLFLTVDGTTVTLALSGGTNQTTERFRIGDTLGYPDARIDDVCFFKGYVLTTTERAHIRNGGTGRTYPFLA